MVRISVAMATYNGARFLRQQLESLAGQRHLPLELHVGDDGSQDDTIAILQDFGRNAPFPVHVRRNEKRLGAGENFLQVARRCAGDWIAFCDQDDVWLPEKLFRCGAGIEQAGPDLRLVAHNALIVRDDLTEISILYRDSYWPKYRLNPRLALPPFWGCAGFTQICHRQLLDIPFDRRRAWPATNSEAHDAWIPILANATGAVLQLGEPLALYRRHDANSSPLWGDKIHTKMARLGRAFRNNGRVYAEESVGAKYIAGVLRETASRVPDSSIAAPLLDAADKVALHSRDLADRAAVYQAVRLRDRLGHFETLRASGAYRSSRAHGFGKRSLLKDIAHAFLATFRRRRIPTNDWLE